MDDSVNEVFNLYELVEIIFKSLPYYYVSCLREINSTCNVVGKIMYTTKWKDDVETRAYDLLNTITLLEYNFITRNQRYVYKVVDKCLFIITCELWCILIHDLDFLDKFIFQCIDFQNFYGKSSLPTDMNLTYINWWVLFKKSFIDYCWIDFPEHYNVNQLKQVARLKGIVNYTKMNRKKLVSILKRPMNLSYVLL
tara:strand:- start:165 stop:752 length:588 start_codon:yes stop_codon:yes gene_type:complete